MNKKVLTEEELIELAKSADQEEAKPLTQFELFMKDVGAGPGSDWVDAQHIYWRYLDWCEKNNIIPQSRHTYSRGINKIYKKGFDKGTVYYIMDKTPFVFTNEEHVGMRRDWRKEKEYRLWRKRSVKGGKQSAKVRKQKRKELKEAQRKKQE